MTKGALVSLALFGAYGQKTLPYRIPAVDSNDVLYASEPEYDEKLQEVVLAILTRLRRSVPQVYSPVYSQGTGSMYVFVCGVSMFSFSKMPNICL